ncbi:GatB/YqeY domain-containing protein, partial [Ramaria rubella]
IKSVLAEVYAAQKQSASATLKPSDITSIIKKAEQRRLDSMRQFESASRMDLAEREQKEAAILATYLPAMLSTAEIDTVLRRIITESSEQVNIKKAKGHALRSFYSEIDKNAVQGDIVIQRLDKLWSL